MTYNIILKPSGLSFEADAESTILDSALSKNINLEYSCKNGDCGTCTATLLSGRVKVEDGEVVSAGEFLTCKASPLESVRIEANYFPELSEISRGVVPLKVNSVEEVADDVVVLRFRIPPTANFKYLAGQSLDLSYQGVTRAYSIANMCEKGGGLELHVKRVHGGEMSSKLFGGVQKDALMRAFGPNGTFFVRQSDAPVAFLVTGTGFAPAKAMIEQLLVENATREIYIFWGGRHEADLYSPLPNHWCESFSNIKYVPVLSRQNEGWCGQSGYVQSAFVNLVEDISKFHVYACGSPAMIDSAKSLLISHGLNESNFFSDAFVATTK